MSNRNVKGEVWANAQPYFKQAYGYLEKFLSTSTKSTRTESKQKLETFSSTTLEAKPKEKAMTTETAIELSYKIPKARDTAKRIREYMKAHPNTRPLFVAKALGCNPNQVYAERYALKKKKKGTWKTTAIAVSKKAITTKLAAGANGTSASDMVNHPPHYKVGGIETISFIKAKLSKDEYIGYLRGNVLKYASRLGAKSNASEDAGKMAWYSNELAKAMKG